MEPHNHKRLQKAKRKRGDNWLEEDKNLLQKLIKRNIKSIENKNTDTNTNRKKQNAWCEVAQSFNQICVGAQRTVEQLKSQWNTLKAQTRKTVSFRHKLTKATTDEPPHPDEVVCGSDTSVNEYITDCNKYDVNKSNIEYCTNDETESYVDSKYNVDSFNGENSEKDLLEVNASVGNVKDQTGNFKSKKRKKNTKYQQFNCDAKVKELADVDIKCRLELHKIQLEKEKIILENEKKRSKILDLEYDLMKAKLLKEAGELHV